LKSWILHLKAHAIGLQLWINPKAQTAIAEGRRQKAKSFYVYYGYVVARAVKESPKLYGDSYNLAMEPEYVPRKNLSQLDRVVNCFPIASNFDGLDEF
jgi:hypothetical protein